MKKDEQKDDWANQKCIGHEVFYHVAQETGAYELWIKLEDVSKQSLIDEKTCEFEVSERDYNYRIYKRVLKFDQSVGECCPTI